MAIYFCFSAFNEEENLPDLFKAIQSCAALLPDRIHIIACNDGSTDRTAALLPARPVTVVGSTVNRGLGYGLAALVKHVAEVGVDEDIAIFLDADNTHDPLLAAIFADKITQGADVVIGSRFIAAKAGAGRCAPVCRPFNPWRCSILIFRLFFQCIRIRPF